MIKGPQSVLTAFRRPGTPTGKIGRIRWTRVPSRHRALTAMLIAATAVRLGAIVGYSPALWFNDSFEYLGVALRPQPYVVRPFGYSFFLMVSQPFHSFRLVVIVQHLSGLAIAVMLYALLRRYGAAGWLAAVATAPQLLDGYQIQVEHVVMAETLFTFLSVAAIVTLLWWRQVPTGAALAAGVLLAAAALTRTVGLPLAMTAVLWLLARRPGRRPLVAFSLALVIPLAGYSAWFQSVHGKAGITGSEGVFLYSRTTSFVDCSRIRPPADLALLCPAEPPGERQPPLNYIWNTDTPLHAIPGPIFSSSKDSLARRFALRAITAQPLDYVSVAVRDFARTFGPRGTDYPNALMTRPFLFHDPPDPVPNRTYVAGGSALDDVDTYERGSAVHHLRQPFADWLVSYQRHVAVPGPVLGLLLLASLVGVAVTARHRHQLRGALVLITAASLTLLAVPPLTAGFDHRYVLPALPFLGAGAGLAAHAIQVIRRSPDTGAGTPRPRPRHRLGST